jgi:L-carnitine/gamma-butyrobetaine antiporter
MNKKQMGDDSRRVDYFIAIPAVVVILAFAVAIFLNRDAMDAFMSNVFWTVNNSVGWLWLVFCLACLFVSLWLAFGRYGNKRFGDDKPDTSTFSFYANLFVFGSSASLVYWVFIEFFMYLEGPPFGAEPFSVEALKWASTYGSFHWGIVPFSSYAVIAVAFAFFMYVKRKKTSRVSAACEFIIGERNANGILGKVIDCFFLMAIILSNAGYSMGVSVPIVGTFVERVFGVDHTLTMDIVIIALVTVACAVAMYTGLNKGMTMVNNIRVVLFFSVAAFVVLAGPTSFIINNTIESIGWQVQHLFQMSLYTGASDASGWPQGWTMFFNIMFIAPIISCGLYYGKLCKGRTVRECVIGIIVASAIGCGIFFWTMGNYSIAAYLGNPEVFKAMYASSPYDAILYVIDTLPFSNVMMVIILIYAFLSTWTYVQSAIYSNAMVAQPNLPEDEEPSKLGRVGWCVVTGVMAVAFLYIGGLQTVKNSMIWAGIPSFILAIIVIAGNFKDMKQIWGGNPDRAKKKSDTSTDIVSGQV